MGGGEHVPRRTSVVGLDRIGAAWHLALGWYQLRPQTCLELQSTLVAAREVLVFFLESWRCLGGAS